MANQAVATESRWMQFQDIVGVECMDQIYDAMKALLNGETQQVCVNRQSDREPITVEWHPITVEERRHWPGSGRD